jgi:putative ATP-dependent endonuclease of OLD family
MAGRIAPLEIAENGLGYNNLLYMAVLLSALAEDTDAELRVLLVEEPRQAAAAAATSANSR